MCSVEDCLNRLILFLLYFMDVLHMGMFWLSNSRIKKIVLRGEVAAE
jgi:hypothetical protein